jgi:predicted Mrr-cat superfamily restriction endonuclease
LREQGMAVKWLIRRIQRCEMKQAYRSSRYLKAALREQGMAVKWLIRRIQRCEMKQAYRSSRYLKAAVNSSNLLLLIDSILV